VSEGERTGPDAAPGDGTGTSPPPLDESLRAVGQAGRASLGATVDSLRALRSLFSADVALARSAMGRALAWTGVAVVFGATGWLLATAAGVALLQGMGLSWLASLSIAALFNLAITGLAAWRTARFFDHMGLHATRRQLSRLGLFDEDNPDEDDDAAATAISPVPASTDGEPRP